MTVLSSIKARSTFQYQICEDVKEQGYSIPQIFISTSPINHDNDSRSELFKINLPQLMTDNMQFIHEFLYLLMQIKE